jgi:mannose-6-phosphate isomerase-like protein (cupin superfamily)
VAKTGQIISNPITGERITFLKTSADTGGELLSVEVELPPRARGVPPHYHLAQTERFETLEGTLDVHVGGRDLRLLPGEPAEVSPRVIHRFWNGSERPARFSCDIRNPGRIETSLEAAHGLARDGKTNEKGVPRNPFQLALLFELSESYLAGPPVPIQRAMSGALARVARLLGYSDEFPEYAGVSAVEPSAAYPASSNDTDALSGSGRMLTWISASYLLVAGTGAAIALREGLPGEFAGRSGGRSSAADFLGTGTALSPGLPMLAAQALFTVLGTRGGRTGTAGVAGLTALGALATIGMLGEPVAYRCLAPGTFEPRKATLVSALVALPSLMTALGAKRLLDTRSKG